jgi:hypothetical protein
MFDLKLREQIARLVTGEITPAELEAWVSAEAWDVDDEAPATRQLAFQVLGLTSEYANGDWDEAELRERLGALSRIYWFEQAPKNVVGGAETTVIRRGRWSAGSDRSLVVESA